MLPFLGPIFPRNIAPYSLRSFLRVPPSPPVFVSFFFVSFPRPLVLSSSHPLPLSLVHSLLCSRLGVLSHSCCILHCCKSILFIMAFLINPTAIPPITALRQELDYGDPLLPRCQAFYDSVRVFRKTFVSSLGREGSSLQDWKSREHQTGLVEMVRSYLELHRNGRLFWPDDRSQSRANKLRYSTDSAR